MHAPGELDAGTRLARASLTPVPTSARFGAGYPQVTVERLALRNPLPHRCLMGSHFAISSTLALALAPALAIASDQYGLIGWHQARDTGITKSDVRRLTRNGTWGRPYTGVYSVRALLDRGTPDKRLRTAVMAAQLALGPASFAAGETAALLWGMSGLPEWDGRAVHMAVPEMGAQRHPRSIRLHTWKILPEKITTAHGPLRLTTPGRTLRDTVLCVDRQTAVCLIDSALHRRMIHAQDIERLEHANRGRRGCVRVRR